MKRSVLKPHDKPAVRRRFFTWDLEWIPGDVKEAKKRGFEPLQFRLAGVYDGLNYRHYQSIADFLNGELIAENSGVWFYAHAGGLADMKFIFDFLCNEPHSFEVMAAFSGSSAIIVELKKGGHKWTFVDSFWLIRMSLRQIGKLFGVGEKGGSADSTEMFYASYKELIPYNEQDCRILYKAIQYIENFFIDLGGQLEKTAASCAMKLFRMNYLKREIKTSAYINECARNAYIASRVEVLQKEVQAAQYFDINSSFPYAMTFPMPASHWKSHRKLPEKEGIYLVDARITVPDSHIPPLPYRSEEGLFFPTGTWRSWFMGPDLQLLEEAGGKIDRVYCCHEFEQFSDLRDYSLDLYEKRKAATNQALKTSLKIPLNSLYGKFGEKEEKQAVYINPSKKTLAQKKLKTIYAGIFQEDKTTFVQHVWVPICAQVTAHGRKFLTDYMRSAGECYYCDTDGLAVPPDVTFETGNELGQLKLEKTIERGVFHAPKMYALKEEEKGWLVKAKGFAKVKDENGEMKPLSYEQFCALRSGAVVQQERFERARAGFRSGDTSPKEFIFEKKLRGVAREKRNFAPDGTSVPWTVEELKSKKSKAS